MISSKDSQTSFPFSSPTLLFHLFTFLFKSLPLNELQTIPSGAFSHTPRLNSLSVLFYQFTLLCQFFFMDLSLNSLVSLPSNLFSSIRNLKSFYSFSFFISSFIIVVSQKPEIKYNHRYSKRGF